MTQKKIRPSFSGNCFRDARGAWAWKFTMTIPGMDDSVTIEKDPLSHACITKELAVMEMQKGMAKTLAVCLDVLGEMPEMTIDMETGEIKTTEENENGNSDISKKE